MSRVRINRTDIKRMPEELRKWLEDRHITYVDFTDGVTKPSRTAPRKPSRRKNG